MSRMTDIIRGAAGLQALDADGMKKAAELCFVVSCFFILPLIFFTDSLGTAAKVAGQVLWGLTVWRGVTLLNRRDRLKKERDGR